MKSPPFLSKKTPKKLFGVEVGLGIGLKSWNLCSDYLL
ncbi:hypothetical protein BN938_0130 [Mucinivorans hirudinis]|uniref:Uncharacterized protein n=1 Tax=Mucinivorans hirudinis TaxID=1433126 RepID=A0A060R5X1_9BACT|nr:hypothetical protein BN938_0130 [Mucinivorans hirudinis]